MYRFAFNLVPSPGRVNRRHRRHPTIILVVISSSPVTFPSYAIRSCAETSNYTYNTHNGENISFLENFNFFPLNISRPKQFLSCKKATERFKFLYSFIIIFGIEFRLSKSNDYFEIHYLCVRCFVV